MSDAPRYRLDDLRRFATALAAGAGVAPQRAATLATQLLWFDAAGAARHGIATLPDLLGGIESGSLDPKAEGAVTTERTGTAVFDAARGLPLLALERAAGIAGEKARDSGAALVRVVNVGALGSAAAVASELALGPMAAFLLGPGPCWSVALPGEGGDPALFDTTLDDQAPGDPAALAALLPWAPAVAPDGGWLVAAVAVKALEPLATFHERALAVLRAGPESANAVRREAARREARERGVAVATAAWQALLGRAERLGVAPPSALPAPERPPRPTRRRP